MIDLGVQLSDEMLENLIDVIPRKAVEAYIERQLVEIRSDQLWQYGRDNFFNDDGTPWLMSPGELAIYKAIVLRDRKWVHALSSTQYGKTQTIARGLTTRVTTYPEEWLDVTPDMKRGRIMIKYMIEDASRNDYFGQKLVGVNVKERDLLMRLLEERSKVKLTFQVYSEGEDRAKYGSAEILSVDARRKQNAINTVMGFGGRNIIQDEASLVDDDVDSAVFRMLAGKGEDTFLMKVGNALRRGHFTDTWHDRDFAKIYIDYVIGLAEGRYTEAFIEKARTKPNFGGFFESRFPGANQADRKRWVSILTVDEIKAAMKNTDHFGEERIGGDVADAGDNASVIVKRSAGFAEILYHDEGVDCVQFAGPVVLRTVETNSKKAYIDRVGVGAGTVGKFREVNRTVYDDKLKLWAVAGSEEPIDKRQFANRRAEMWWGVRQWIKGGGRLSEDPRWLQMADVKYRTKEGTDQIEIMSKREMREAGIPSPDDGDALSLTFYEPHTQQTMSPEDKFFYRKMRENQRRERVRRKSSFY